MLENAQFNSLIDNSVVWGVYLAAACAVLLSYWGLTRRWWFELRWILFALLAVFLLMPAPVPGRAVQAPAMIMVALSPFTGTPEVIASVLARLLLAGVAALVFVIVVSVARRVYRRRRAAE